MSLLLAGGILVLIVIAAGVVKTLLDVLLN